MIMKSGWVEEIHTHCTLKLMWVQKRKSYKGFRDSHKSAVLVSKAVQKGMRWSKEQTETAFSFKVTI